MSVAYRRASRAGLRWVAALVMLAALSPVASAAPSPRQVVEQATNEVFAAIRAHRQAIDRESGELYRLIARIVVPHFDVEYISRSVLGRYWRRLSPAQRERFEKGFEALLVRTYATGLRDYAGGVRIDYLPERGTPGPGRAQVRTLVHPPGGQPSFHIDYYLRERDGTWKVYNVEIEGVSLIINYRATFADIISRDGLNGLLERLVAKAAGQEAK